ncbi:MAG: TGS domain-containing protein [Phycisphaerales bacterium]|nr:MAG: TGS domain-containing protein [Phycisphaerales bacterium]
MVLNVRADYIRAEEKYKAARTDEEKLQALREMLATAPKHKSAEKLLKDIKQRISRLRHECAEKRKKAGHADPFAIRPQGAGQVFLVGTPNTGKSRIVAMLTKASVKVEEYPFTTQLPVPGMAHHEDVPIQLVDTPPLTATHVPKGMAGAVDHTDAVLIVIDGAAGSALEDLEVCLKFLASRKLSPVFDPEPSSEEDDELMPIRALVACTKMDLTGAPETLRTLRELYTERLRFVGVSTETGEGLDEMLRLLFELLHVIRVYAKPPGKPPDMDQPFILHVGSTVKDLAEDIHREMAGKIRSARVWGGSVHDGQQVHIDYVLNDRDVVQLSA